ncbi:DNA polymerase IV [Escherichia coli]|nr:DNA polymerase IV [Escherichia coli]
MGLRTCGDVQKCDLVMLLKRFGKFGRILWERSQGIDERDVNSERLRKSVGVERTMAEDIHHWSECEAIIERLYPELERRLAKVKPDLLIARQGVKLKFDDFQQTTQEHVWPRLNKADLIATARKTWDERRGGRGVRLVGLHVTLLDPQMERQLVLDYDVYYYVYSGVHYYEGITVCIEFSLKNRSISLSYVKTQLNTLLINRLRFFLIIAPQDIS